MRLKNIYLICNENKDAIRGSKYSNITLGGSPYIRISNWGDMNDAFQSIREIDYLNTYVEKLYDISPVLTMGKEVVDLDGSQFNEFETLRQSLYIKVNSIAELYESISSPEENTGFDIKLPEFTNLSEFLSYIKDLNFILETPLLSDVKEYMRFNKVDLGSTWLVFTGVAAGATKILEKLAKIVDKAMFVKSHNLNCKMQKENLRAMGIQNDFLDDLTNKFSEATKTIVDKCLQELETEFGELSNGEEKDKTKMAIEKLADLMGIGLQIYASIETDRKIQVLFPSEETYKLENTQRKLLENNTDKINEDNGN